MLEGSLFSMIFFLGFLLLGPILRIERKVEEKDRVNWIVELMKWCSL
jgi:hypothetical protein